MFYKFRLDQPETFGPGVTDRNLAFEIDAYVDWKSERELHRQLRRRVRQSGEGGAAGSQGGRRTSPTAWLYVAYSF